MFIATWAISKEYLGSEDIPCNEIIDAGLKTCLWSR